MCSDCPAADGVSAGNMRLVPALGRGGARDLADLTGLIWDEDIDEEDYAAFERNISLFPDGHMLVITGEAAVASAAGFPVAAVPSFRQLNAGVYRLLDPGGPLYYIHLIQVAPEYRGQGLGYRLLQEQLAVARRTGCTEVIGIAAAHAIDYWCRKGFRAFGRWGTYRRYGRFRRVRLPVTE